MTGLAFVANQPLLVGVSPAGMVVWNLMTLTAWRSVSVPCAAVVSHPTMPTFAVTVVPRAAAVAAVQSAAAAAAAATAAIGDDNTAAAAAAAAAAAGITGCFVVQFEGADAAPARCWGAPGGAPQAVLYPPAGEGGVVVVTHDRRLVTAGMRRTPTTEAVDGGDDVEGALPPVGGGEKGAAARARAAGRMAGGALKSFDKLGPAEGTLRSDGGAIASAVGANAKRGGGVPWGDLFDAPSHSLPPLTTLAPHFLDALLDHQSVPTGGGGGTSR